MEGIKEDSSDNDRIRCKVEEIREYESLGEIEDLLHKCIQETRAIIYVNTVAKAIEYYHWFKKKGVKPILYHSRFTEPDKKLKEQVLLDALGKHAWESGNAKGIAILTQIGEMSVNISADMMISEICPMDRLVQRAGRLCRFDKNKIGKLYVVVPKQNDTLYPAPYGKYIPRQGWEANQALIKTIELLETKDYSASDFIQLINNIYPSFKEFSVKTKENADLLKTKFVSNWIILPLEQSKEDDTDSQNWKSRDIIGNESVFVQYPEIDNFYFWQDFQEFKIENSIDVAAYLIVNGIKNKRIIKKQIKVSEETKTIYLALNAYSVNFGLQLSENSVDDQFL
ncbi:MAG: CRISPR-associated helicase Cas3' [Candidatus Kuenenia stuttgartiensis]|nr:CRISPR-associated helicase Cas3' [Candidatus Kuenenia stuttgartiensis]